MVKPRPSDDSPAVFADAPIVGSTGPTVQRRAVIPVRRHDGRGTASNVHDGVMRILFCAAPGVGHVLPLLPVARAARARGHDVVVGCGESLANIVVGAGFRHVPLGPATFDEVLARVTGIAEATGRDRAVLAFRDGFGGAVARAIAADALAFAADWRPAVVIHEDMEMGSWIAAERLGIPHVVVQATAWRPDKRALVIATQNELRVRHGLAADPELAGRDGSFYFTTRPSSLRDPTAPAPAQLRELRPQADDRLGTEEAPPDWLAAPTGRPRVAVTLGTVNGHRVDLLRPIVDGLASLDVEVAVALGADPATLGPMPPNARVERYIPMSVLLPRSDVIVHHAGSGTMLAALAAGIPMAMLPIAADQHDNTDRCVAAGVAVVLDQPALTGDSVRTAVARLLTEPGFADRARAVAAEIASMPDADAAMAEIETIMGSGEPGVISAGEVSR